MVVAMQGDRRIPGDWPREAMMVENAGSAEKSDWRVSGEFPVAGSSGCWRAARGRQWRRVAGREESAAHETAGEAAGPVLSVPAAFGGITTETTFTRSIRHVSLLCVLYRLCCGCSLIIFGARHWGSVTVLVIIQGVFPGFGAGRWLLRGQIANVSFKIG